MYMFRNFHPYDFRHPCCSNLWQILSRNVASLFATIVFVALSQGSKSMNHWCLPTFVHLICPSMYHLKLVLLHSFFLQCSAEENVSNWPPVAQSKSKHLFQQHITVVISCKNPKIICYWIGEYSSVHDEAFIVELHSTLQITLEVSLF